MENSVITITAVDMHSSDSTTRTFTVEPITTLKNSIMEWEKELPYHRYELSTQDFIEGYLNDVINIIDELEVDY